MIGDTHLGLGFPNKKDKWLNVHREYFTDFLFPLLTENVKDGDIIIHLGDLFHDRDILPIDIYNYGFNIVEKLSKIAPTYIITGNHDLWTKSTSEINSINPFKYIPNVFIYSKTSEVEYNGLKLCLMPYIDSKRDQIKQLKDFKHCDYLFCHSDLNGCRMHLTSTAHRNLNKIDIDEFKSFKRTFSGHIHIRQENKNFEFIGSNFQMDRNDYGDQKGITVLDTNTGEQVFYPNKISPIFKKVTILEEDDMEKLEELKDSKDYIDITISNNLLVNNRKIRRKLEVLLEKGEFSSIDYLNDIVDKDDNVDNLEDEINSINEENELDISIQLDYEEYIAKYIKSKKYKESEFNNKLLEYYDNIIEIYQRNYKLNLNENN